MRAGEVSPSPEKVELNWTPTVEGWAREQNLGETSRERESLPVSLLLPLLCYVGVWWRCRSQCPSAGPWGQQMQR